MVMVMVAVG
ncbi:hypothetical protein E2C01_059694 [Portunus trituberculatus]|uniref:Uncharacterized protein n=1 Tax=Portunus trituberculatus TaxID=210409 RepID=A0A5B7H6J9_PORTR|nr:hypothetical protein [Portunus trituberculatus]